MCSGGRGKTELSKGRPKGRFTLRRGEVEKKRDNKRPRWQSEREGEEKERGEQETERRGVMLYVVHGSMGYSKARLAGTLGRSRHGIVGLGQSIILE